MKSSKKKYIFIFFLVTMTAVGFYYSSPTKSTLVKQPSKLKESEVAKIDRYENKSTRLPASVVINKNVVTSKPVSYSDEQSQAIINKTSKMYFSKLPKNIEWDLTHVADLAKGNQLKISLHNTHTGEKTSYHALVDKNSGKILTTWHRQIHR